MKRYNWPVLFFTLLLLAISCTEGKCDLLVTSSTVDEDPSVSYYGCTIENGSYHAESGSTDGKTVFYDVPPGQVNITVTAISERYDLTYEASSSYMVKPGENKAHLILTPKSPDEKDMVLHFPSLQDSFATLRSEGNGRILFQDERIENGLINLSALAYGKYIITVTRIENGKPVKLDYRFVCSSSTPEELIFLGENDSGEKQGDVMLDFFDLSSSPIEGKIHIKDRTEKLILELEILKMDAELEEKEIGFLWFEDGIYRNSGKTLEVEKSNGVHRFDCFIKSRFLGSYGSETINISISR